MLAASSKRLLRVVVVVAISCQTTSHLVHAQSIKPPPARPADLPRGAHWVRLLSSDECDVFRDQQRLWIVPKKQSVESGRLTIPRLCASIRSMQWSDDAERNLKFTPEPENWNFTWKGTLAKSSRIEVTFDSEPILPSQRRRASAAGDGTIMLLANQATTIGQKLRFEPQPHKNTVGYWTIPTDYAQWDLQIDTPGEYTVAILQGCGAGQGGSNAAISLRDDEQTVSELKFQTVETGHFQNFQWNHLGRISVERRGTYQLRITPTKIVKAALCDVRMIHLVRQAK